MPVAVITGASAGIGRATAKAFAEAGYDVALLARGEAGLKAAAAEIEATGQRALPIPTDVAVYDQVEAAAARAEAELGEIDVWVNDAMTTVFAPSWEVDAPSFQRAVEVTFLGQVWGTTAALARMRPRDRGTIVNIGSAMAFIGIPLQSAYCASKFACRGYFESVRAELLHTGSNVVMTMVHMPAVNTPQFDWCETTLDHHPQPVPPIYQPEVCARAIVAAAIDGRRAKVVGSWNKMLVGLASLMPGLANQYAARGAWDTQLTSQKIDPSTRQANLHSPVDDDQDAGAHGIFDSKARGFWDPSFLKTLPTSAKTFVDATSAVWKEKAGRYRRQADQIAGDRTAPASGR
ncbi:MAG TPA: SDR family oxidoreductase [Acidimicrobiales bacterium]|nr:SDR family oxidoreductase [Acidimicrobiales bacterium]